MSKSTSTSVFTVKVGDIVVHFYRQYRKSSDKIYFYAVTSVNGKCRTKYVGKELPGEDTLNTIARSMVVSESEWKNRDKKSSCRPKKLDAPNPVTFPPEQYPYMYEPGAVEKIQVKRLTSECVELRKKVTALIEQVNGLAVAVELGAAEVNRLKFENAALFGANKSLSQEIKNAEDAMKLMELCCSAQIEETVAERLQQSRKRDSEVAALALQIVREADFALGDKRLEPLGVTIAKKTRRLASSICSLVNGDSDG